MKSALLLLAFCPQEPPAQGKPLLKDFVGINGHYTFRPGLYRPVVSRVRNYHSMEWDTGKDTDHATEFPFARNRVNWETLYGGWKKEGFDIDASIMFAGIGQKDWKDVAADARRYGKAFAEALGPSSRNLVSSAEIGNEPGHYDDPFYRSLFEAMARGLREGDPRLRIATCAMVDGPSHKYAKSLACVKGLEELYDVLNLHTYAEAEPWPTWRRSHPEDPKIPYLQDVRKVVAWRDAHAKGKPVWVTEYGWDSSTQKPEPKGDFAKWVGVGDEQQAQYLVRSTLVFMTLDVRRAYIYFYDDEDKPSLHASSGITRRFQPKPSYHALAHLRRTLGDFRLARVRLAEEDVAYVYEFAHGAEPARRILAAWSPTGTGRTATLELDLGGARITRAERMPLAAGEAPAVPVDASAGPARIPLSESPIYLWLE
jgi:hypothetical protein